MPTILVHPAGIDENGRLDEESMIRIFKGFFVYVELLKKGVDAYFVSSVQDRFEDKKECLSQSEEIKRNLILWGVPEKQIVISNRSSYTFKDICESFELIKNHKLPQPIINVSSWYHIPRIRLIWHLLRKEFNYPKVEYVSAGTVLLMGFIRAHKDY